MFCTHFPTKNAVPTHEIVLDAFKSFAITGVAVDTAVWSIKATKRARPIEIFHGSAWCCSCKIMIAYELRFLTYAKVDD